MESFNIRIADLVVRVEPLFQSTYAYFRKYVTDFSHDYSVCVVDEDLVFEQRMLDIEAQEEGLRLREFTGPFLERTAIQRKIAIELLKRNTLLLHGSTIGLDGEAYLFTAACGTGKSTHTRLWRECFGSRTVMINDDKPFLKIGNDTVTAYGSPWSGKHGLDSNISLPLKGICILNRGSENRIYRITAEQARSMLFHQSFFPVDAVLQDKSKALVENLMRLVPLWEMSCNKDPEAAFVSCSAMTGNDIFRNQ